MTDESPGGLYQKLRELSVLIGVLLLLGYQLLSRRLVEDKDGD